MDQHPGAEWEGTDNTFLAVIDSDWIGMANLEMRAL